MKNFYEAQNLYFAYPHKEIIINNLSLKIENGEKVMILCPDEMGKTTLVNVLSGFSYGYFGKIIFNDKTIKEYNPCDLKFSIIYKDFVFLNKTIKDNLLYQCKVNKLPNLEDNELEILLKEFKISESLNSKIDKLSKLSKMKLALLRSFIKDPNILFLDDPFFDFNEKENLEIFDIINKKFKDKTILFLIGDSSFKKLIFSCNCIFQKTQIYYFSYGKLLKYNDFNDFLIKLPDIFSYKFNKNLAECNGTITTIKSNNILLYNHNNNDLEISLKNLKGNFENEDVIICYDKDKKISSELKNNNCLIYSKLTGKRLL